MKKLSRIFVSLAILLTVILPLNCIAATDTRVSGSIPNKFEDMENHWAKDAVAKLTAQGIIDSKSSTRFIPESEITSAEFCVLISKAIRSTDKVYKVQISDGTADDSFVDGAAVMEKIGIVVDNAEKFNYGEKITHEQAVKILVMVYEFLCGRLEAPGLSTYFDDYFDISTWARPYINKGAMISVAKGFDKLTEFKPQDMTTRAQAAYMIYNFKNAIEVSGK